MSLAGFQDVKHISIEIFHTAQQASSYKKNSPCLLNTDTSIVVPPDICYRLIVSMHQLGRLILYLFLVRNLNPFQPCNFVWLLLQSASKSRVCCCHCSPHCCNLPWVVKITAHSGSTQNHSIKTNFSHWHDTAHQSERTETAWKCSKTFCSKLPFPKQFRGKGNVLSSHYRPLTGCTVFCSRVLLNRWPKSVKLEFFLHTHSKVNTCGSFFEMEELPFRITENAPIPTDMLPSS